MNRSSSLPSLGQDGFRAQNLRRDEAARVPAHQRLLAEHQKRSSIPSLGTRPFVPPTENKIGSIPMNRVLERSQSSFALSPSASAILKPTEISTLLPPLQQTRSGSKLPHSEDDIGGTLNEINWCLNNKGSTGHLRDVLKKFVQANRDFNHGPYQRGAGADRMAQLTALLFDPGILQSEELLSLVLKVLSITFTKQHTRLTWGEDALKQLIRIFRGAMDDGLVAQAGLCAGALRLLTLEPNNLATVLDSEALATLMALLLEYLHPDAQTSAAEALYTICNYKTGRQQLLLLEPIPTLLALLPSPGPKLRHKILGTLHSLSAVPMAIYAIRTGGGLPQLLTLLRDDNVELCCAAAGTIQNMARELRSRHMLRESEAVPALLRLMFIDHVECQAKATAALLNLLVDEDGEAAREQNPDGFFSIATESDNLPIAHDASDSIAIPNKESDANEQKGLRGQLDGTSVAKHEMRSLLESLLADCLVLGMVYAALNPGSTNPIDLIDEVSALAHSRVGRIPDPASADPDIHGMSLTARASSTPPSSRRGAWVVQAIGPDSATNETLQDTGANSSSAKDCNKSDKTRILNPGPLFDSDSEPILLTNSRSLANSSDLFANELACSPVGLLQRGESGSNYIADAKHITPDANFVSGPENSIYASDGIPINDEGQAEDQAENSMEQAYLEQAMFEGGNRVELYFSGVFPSFGLLYFCS
jgi:hypothetical protein